MNALPLFHALGQPLLVGASRKRMIGALSGEAPAHQRLGGSIIASHIRIPDGGPVPDMVHYHTVGFQLIYCYKGWVDVLYEDQGNEMMRLSAGDCVIQPPEIRHRV